MSTASTAVANKSQGVIKTIIKIATANWKVHVFGFSKIEFISIKNTGTELIQIAWDTDDKDAQTNPEYTSIAVGERLPTVGITKDTQMHYKRGTGTGSHRLEIIAWG